MNEELQKLFNNLIQVEHLSTTLYLAMSAYMGRLNLTGMAHWLRLQSEEERTHMLKLIDFVVNRDGTVQLMNLPAQPNDFGTPLETFQKVLAHEQFVTNSYRQAFNYVNQVDPQATVIIQDFLREQIDEEAQAKTIVDRLKLAENNPSAILLLDQELGARTNTTTAAPTPPAG
ncbi:ferritin [Caldibacillus thermolactis]|jgi:ferritin|uniref:Ferritin n=1 Tax=Pallidibacillus thermolactis TaxID=251051 RepID=A0ABT2WH52_9BACI|nr:ferritin [Pallidibacillus thermolactis]MCU9595009.1 ferritin [Pallidibacillus thermolactis]MED1673510.1 ferritin [Pallidibacillus thermolactis subsp. kokeshiiformis]